MTYLTYIPPKLVIAEAIEIKVGGCKEDLHDIGHHNKILEHFVVSVPEGLHDPGHCHGDVGRKEHDGHHEQQPDETPVLFGNVIILGFRVFSCEIY